LQDIYSKIVELLDRDETFALVTIVDYKGSVPRRLAKMIVAKDGKTYGTIGGGCVEGQAAEEAALMLKEAAEGVRIRSYDLVEEDFGGVGMTCGGKIDVSIEIIEPDPHLIIAGSGHIAKAIAKLAQMLGFDVTVIDPIAKRESFPESRRVISDFVETNLPNIRSSPNTYIVIVTRHKDDLPALRSSLKTESGYIGLIGSKRRILQAFQILLKEGLTEEQLERVHAPVGLEIGAETPEEIAVSIMAEIIQHRRVGTSMAAEPMKVKFTSLKAISRGSSLEKA
jgi:xanthine dehydrogenase accessory factor